MIYKFNVYYEEDDKFLRQIEINSDATFLDFNNIILASVKYTNDQLTSFFHCMDNWDRLEEITVMEMFTNSDTDSYVMEKTYIDEFVQSKNDRLIFQFDNLADRYFLIKLIEILPGQTEAKITKSTGKAPEQTSMFDDAIIDSVPSMDLGSEFYGDSEFSDDEFDEESFTTLDEFEASQY